MPRAGFTNRYFHSKGVAFLKQKEYSFSIGNIPLQKATSLENRSLHFDYQCFFPTCKNAFLIHRPISYRTKYNTTGRKKHVAQTVPATYKASSNQMQYLFKSNKTIFRNVAITLKNIHGFLKVTLYLLKNKLDIF